MHQKPQNFPSRFIRVREQIERPAFLLGLMQDGRMEQDCPLASAFRGPGAADHFGFRRIGPFPVVDDPGAVLTEHRFRVF